MRTSKNRTYFGHRINGRKTFNEKMEEGGWLFYLAAVGAGVALFLLIYALLAVGVLLDM